MDALLTFTNLGMFVGGVFIAVLAVVFGGTMFISVPIFQLVFPEVSIGQIVGNLKVGSVVRGFASTWQTWDHIDWRYIFRKAPPFFVGAIVGAFVTSDLSQLGILPLVVVAIALSECRETIAKLRFGPALSLVLAFLAGVYSGVLGIGIGILFVALLRQDCPADEDIALVKIRARALELAVSIVAVTIHLYNNNLKLEMFAFWALGSLVGGVIGGIALSKMTTLSGEWQKRLLWFSYALSFITAFYAAGLIILSRYFVDV